MLQTVAYPYLVTTRNGYGAHSIQFKHSISSHKHTPPHHDGASKGPRLSQLGRPNANSRRCSLRALGFASVLPKGHRLWAPSSPSLAAVALRLCTHDPVCTVDTGHKALCSVSILRERNAPPANLAHMRVCAGGTFEQIRIRKPGKVIPGVLICLSGKLNPSMVTSIL